MKPSPWPAAVPPEELGDPAVILAHGAHEGPIKVEILHASPEHRRALVPCIRLLRSGPRPPAGERITITIARPDLLARFLEGDLRVANLEALTPLVGLELRPEPDRQGPLAPLLTWCAQLGDLLRAHLRAPDTP
jgi:hypothetical protein